MLLAEILSAVTVVLPVLTQIKAAATKMSMKMRILPMAAS
jgi:hypothetical protein